MEGELVNLAKVWLSVYISLSYCYLISKLVAKGTRRFLCVLPIISLYLFLPLTISSVHFSGITGFFIAWLANFKLLLFAFGKGPLDSDPSISLGRFVALACLPIKTIQHNPFPGQSHRPKNSQIQSESPHLNSKSFDRNEKTPPPNPSEEPKISQTETNPSSIIPSKGNMPLLQYFMKGLFLAILVKLYDYSDYLHPKLVLGMYCFHIYFLLELNLVIAAAMARALLGLELEPQFNDPLLSASLQDFWGRRWNLMVTSILRPTVYEPTLKGVRHFVGPRWAALPAVLGTFVVSALMHELIIYYIGRSEPTFRMTGFFLLHGLCLMVEIALKKAVNGRWRLPRLISGPLTVVFVLATSVWLFLPELLRCQVDVRAFEEYAALGAFVKNVSQALVV